MNLTSVEVDELIKSYKNKITHIHRYASFDFCYSYFQNFLESGNITDIASNKFREISTLQLAFYLASWGMYRGSTALLQHSSHSLIPVIEYISSTKRSIWEIDVYNYSSRLQDLKNIYSDIGYLISIPLLPKIPSPILVTKILLGVFGISPAMDTYFMKGIGHSTFASSNYLNELNSVGDIWLALERFYKEHQNIINNTVINSLGFDGKQTAHNYSKAKIIDMIFFTKGIDSKDK